MNSLFQKWPFLYGLLMVLIISGCVGHEQVIIQSAKPQLTKSDANRMQSEDVKYMRENWTQEQIDDFAKNYIYKTIIINGDTLK